MTDIFFLLFLKCGLTEIQSCPTIQGIYRRTALFFGILDAEWAEFTSLYKHISNLGT